MTETVSEVLSQVRGQVGFITLNRPRALNALSLAMVRDLMAILLAWQSDERVLAVAVRGSTKEGAFGAFCAGGDIRFLHQAGTVGNPQLEDFFTDEYALIPDYLLEFMKEMRKEQFGDACDKFFKFGSNLNQRDVIAVRKMISGFTKLLYPDGVYNKEDMTEILTISLELRRRVKEQLKKIGGMEFYDVNFSYIDNETFEEHFVPVPEQGGGKLIPEGMPNPGHVYTISRGKTGMVGVYRLETQVLPGNGKFERTGLGTDRDAREATNTAFNYLKANGRGISNSISTTTKDYFINYQDLNGIGITKTLTLPTLVAICSAALQKPTLSNLAVLGDISISGTILKVEELANTLQVCLDSGAKKVLIPITSAVDMATVPPELMGAFSIIFYNTPQEAIFKALGVE